jgi:hypothetical protein
MINHRLLVHSKWCKSQKKRNKPVGDRDHEVLGMPSVEHTNEHVIIAAFSFNPSVIL